MHDYENTYAQMVDEELLALAEEWESLFSRYNGVPENPVSFETGLGTTGPL